MRGDLIETFKVVRGFVNYGQRASRYGLNLLSRGNKVSRNTITRQSRHGSIK